VIFLIAGNDQRLTALIESKLGTCSCSSRGRVNVDRQFVLCSDGFLIKLEIVSLCALQNNVLLLQLHGELNPRGGLSLCAGLSLFSGLSFRVDSARGGLSLRVDSAPGVDSASGVDSVSEADSVSGADSTCGAGPKQLIDGNHSSFISA